MAHCLLKGRSRREGFAMKVALTVWEGHISPLFDATHMLLVVKIERREVTETRLEPFDCESEFSRVSRLDQLGVNVLICGGISRFFANSIEARNIRIIPFSVGKVDEVLDAFIQGTLFSNRFRMPGCDPPRDQGPWGAE
jgi:predicted Fe-Mo cluster-binding NifX family protein